MSDFQLTPYRPERRNAWDQVVAQSKTGNFLHLRPYMDYHAHRFDERSVFVEKRGKPVAVFPCTHADGHVVSHGGLTYGGLLYGPDLHATEVLEIFEALAGHYRAMGACRLTYKAVPHIFHRYPADEDIYALWRMGAQLVRRDLSAAIPPRHRIGLSDSRKCTIRKAMKHDLVVREGDFFDTFHALLAHVLSKFGTAPVHSLDELRLLHDRFPHGIRLFGAFKDEGLLAAALIYDFGTVAHTQYLANSDEGRNIGALDYLLDNMIKEPFSSRDYFSFGISTECGGKVLNQGLCFQKEGLGARAVTHDFYELELG